jgi:hypothetical protein
MAQITASHHEGFDESELEQVRRERLRSAVPVTVAVLALLGVVLAGSFALRSMIDFGVWMIGAS